VLGHISRRPYFAGMALLHNADTIGPSPKISDNTTLCNTGDMPADSRDKAVDIYLVNILLRNKYY